MTMGDIGRPLRKIELEPIPDDIPVEEPAIEPAVPATPVKEPVPA
jgi:hypothetical protein